MAKSVKSTGAASARKSAATTARGAAKSAGNGAVDQQLIARRAYEIYQARGGAPGSALEDWLQAERELRQSR